MAAAATVLWSDFLGLARERGVCLWRLPTPFLHPFLSPAPTLRRAGASKATPPSQKERREKIPGALGSRKARPGLQPVTEAWAAAALAQRGPRLPRTGGLAIDIGLILNTRPRCPFSPDPQSAEGWLPLLSSASPRAQGAEGRCHQRASGLQRNHVNLAMHTSAHTPCVTALPSLTASPPEMPAHPSPASPPNRTPGPLPRPPALYPFHPKAIPGKGRLGFA